MPDRRTPFRLTDERDTLVDFLVYLREGVALKVADLGFDAATRQAVPSGTSLLGLVKHLTWVEEFWFTTALQGLDDPLPSPVLEAGDDVVSVVDDYRTACARSNAVIRAQDDLDVRCARKGVAPEPMSLRWVLVHLVEETARHAGHADIIREQLDGETGR
jgi:uncharacterized damage-inducible protein DinB